MINFPFNPMQISYNLRNRHLFVLDIIIFIITPFISLVIRFDGFKEIPSYTKQVLILIPSFILMKILILYYFDLYRSLWQYASIDELFRILVAGVVIILAQYFFVFALLVNLFSFFTIIPRSLPILDGFISIFGFAIIRFSIRLSERAYQKLYSKSGKRKVLVVGAGEAGMMVAKEMQSNINVGLNPIGFLDDDPSKKNTRIHGLCVFGYIDDAKTVVEKTNPDLIIIAIPSAPGFKIREILSKLHDIPLEKKIIPGLNELLDGRIDLSEIREINIEDLLRRKAVKNNLSDVIKKNKRKIIMVTGAGGSIGSEICRHLIKYKLKQLLLLGHGENSIFEIYRELEAINDISISLVPLICDIRNKSRLDYLIGKYKPEIIFHTAAHKHLSLMETNIPEALTNNVLGTLNLCELAVKYDIDHLTAVSTDKAVRPKSIMGASKRISEKIIQAFALKYNKKFVSVRFGNVLGSKGSVISIFNDQIKKGGPVTVTHKDVNRYFMTIPEAAELVIQATYLGKGGEIFLLDMGEPIKIVDLAKDLIKLNDLELGKDINIVFTGLNTGEKVSEELAMASENFIKTTHEKIFVCSPITDNISKSFTLSFVNDLNSIIDQLSDDQIIKKLQSLIPEFEYDRKSTIEY
ncbi:polysaccharide biosynthesis protein, partial [Bacteroidota bacterium]